MALKFLVHSGYVTSKNDGDTHYISEEKVATLYGVGREMNWISSKRGTRSTLGEYIHLYPDESGKYSLTEAIEKYCISRDQKMIEKIENMDFLSRLKFLFTGKISGKL